MNKNNKPEIRFKGFTDAWEQRKLNEICNYKSSSLTVADRTEQGKFPLYDANGQIGMVDSFYMQEDYITVIKDGAGVGRIRRLPKNTAFIGTMGALTSKNSELNFLYYLLEKKDLSKQYTGSTIPHIYFKDYGRNDVLVSDIKEQQKIGLYFDQLDHLITLHQRKLEKLQNIKKSMLEKMFPKDGNSLPEIRFKGFIDAWEQRKLNEICNYKSSSLTVADRTEQGKFPLYDANGQIGMVDSFYMQEDYITVIKDGAGVGRIRRLPKNTAFIGTMGALTSKNSELNFLYYLLEKKDLSKQYTGSTIPHIYFKDYGRNDVLVSDIKEQQKIGLYFDQLDHLITLHQRKLEKLKIIKNLMLEKMFVK